MYATLDRLKTIAEIAAQIRKDIPENKGPKKLEELQYINPHCRFIRNLIRIFADNAMCLTFDL